jgi:hypothetical protein
LVGNIQRVGMIERIVELGGAAYARVRFPEGVRQIPLGQL